MNHLLNLTKKELKELLAPGAVISIIVMMFLFIGLGTMIGSETENAFDPPTIGLVNGDPGGEWSDFAIASVYSYFEHSWGLTSSEASEHVIMLDSPYGDRDQITQEMIDRGLNIALGIVPDFTQSINGGIQTMVEEYYIFLDTGFLGSATSTISSVTIISQISGSISYELTSNAVGDDDTAEFLLNPIQPSRPVNQYTYIKGDVYSGITPAEITTSLMSQTMMIPIVIMIIIMVIGNMVIASMGSEKENKTLETLLTMPVKRTIIVSGKLLAAAIVGLIYGMLYMVGMSVYMGGVMGPLGSVNLSDYGLSLGLTDWAAIAAMIFLAIFCALGLCMILGAFTKNYKAAQTMMLPIMVLAMLPMFVTMFASWSSLPVVLKGLIFAIPFSHPMMVVNNLMLGDVTVVLAGLAYLLIFTLLVIWAAVRIYKSDILLTGLGQTKAAKIAKTFIGTGKKK